MVINNENKIVFIDELLEEKKGHIASVWINEYGVGIDQSFYSFHQKAGAQVFDFTLYFKEILKPADVFSTPAGFLDYNLVFHLVICDKKNYNVLWRNIIQTLITYKKNDNICKNISFHIPNEVNKLYFIKGLKDYINLVSNIEFRFFTKISPAEIKEIKEFFKLK